MVPRAIPGVYRWGVTRRTGVRSAPSPARGHNGAVTDLDVVRAIYDAMGAREVARLFELLDPAIVVTQDARLPWGGRHVGHDGFAQFGVALTGAIDSAVTTDAFFEADGDVIQIGRTR